MSTKTYGVLCTAAWAKETLTLSLIRPNEASKTLPSANADFSPGVFPGILV